ncbi:hypothetical protein [uncultured Desulfuromonas sp.]|uniref:hypothetical protein n=1 Tax=uncultured Desulfuromonas sp. TaxID=181013 RepID=UPI002AAACCF9|nr:hypothetical protein [uncultured Desulfuromonas sp.]
MPINGITMKMTRDEEHAGRPGQLPLLIGVILTAVSGVYPTGLLLTKNSSGVHKPLQTVTAESIGTGDATEKTFAATLGDELPLEPGFVTITDGTEIFTDDGNGNLVGDAGGTGTVNYATASVSATFNAAPPTDADVAADYMTAIDGVLDVQVDTAHSTAGIAVVLGHVATDTLKIGITDKAAPSAAVMNAMATHYLLTV